MSVAEKFANLARAVKQNGGIWKSIQTLYRIDDLKDGDLIGTDRNGNRYYQNKKYFIGNLTKFFSWYYINLSLTD